MTRAHKGWALDSVVLQNLITRHTKEELNDSPPEGVYVHGLFLEGASLDHRSGKLMESKPKVQQNDWPHLLSAGLKLEAFFHERGIFHYLCKFKKYIWYSIQNSFQVMVQAWSVMV